MFAGRTSVRAGRQARHADLPAAQPAAESAVCPQRYKSGQALPLQPAPPLAGSRASAPPPLARGPPDIDCVGHSQTSDELLLVDVTPVIQQVDCEAGHGQGGCLGKGAFSTAGLCPRGLRLAGLSASQACCKAIIIIWYRIAHGLPLGISRGRPPSTPRAGAQASVWDGRHQRCCHRLLDHVQGLLVAGDDHSNVVRQHGAHLLGCTCAGGLGGRTRMLRQAHPPG